MKLDICGGHASKSGFLNVDINPEYADIVVDISDRLPFRNNSVEGIWSCHTLEHFPRFEAADLIDEFYRILETGGVVNIAVPELQAIAKSYLNGDFPRKKIWQNLYGAQSDKYDFHKFCWEVRTLRPVLRHAGFRDIQEVPYRFHEHIKELTFQLKGVK